VRGDLVGTQRYWDGSQWASEAVGGSADLDVPLASEAGPGSSGTGVGPGARAGAWAGLVANLGVAARVFVVNAPDGIEAAAMAGVL